MEENGRKIQFAHGLAITCLFINNMLFQESDLLFSDKLAPITTGMGFIQAEHQSVVNEFHDWVDEINSRLGRQLSFHESKITGDLETVLRSLLPLQRSNSDKYAVIPTCSNWTVICENDYQGTNPITIGYLAEKLSCLACWFVARPNTGKSAGVSQKGRQGALIFELYGPEQTEWLNLLRQVRLIHSQGEWEFSDFGKPLPFENTAEHQAENISEKFSFNSLCHCLGELGIHPFSPEYYLPPDSKEPHLIQIQGGEIIPGTSLTLQQARKLIGI
jgi:hypothetical protein